jgi:FKBP-type peptidyl-prolyl cis-trans isomerase 2
MKTAQNGDTVRVHFSAYYDDGIQFATTLGEKPMELTIGDKKLLDSFEQSIVGMVVGEKKTVSIEPNQTVGERLPELVVKISRGAVSEQHEDLKVGSKVHAKDDVGNPVIGKVTQLTDDETIQSACPLLFFFDLQPKKSKYRVQQSNVQVLY